MTDEKDPSAPTDKQGTEWQQDLVNRLAFASLNEQRRSRRWGILFKTLIFVYLFSLLFLYRPGVWQADGLTMKSHTALVELDGVIGADTMASADMIITGLRDAFEAKHVKGVILRINSPGGSPVQAGYIYDEIRRLRAEHTHIPVYAVVTDICASGGYYVAAAADEIYADKASIVGSIGVRMDSFGFVGAMEKLGIERRLLTAGEHKGFLDPFQEAREADVAHIQGLLNNIHTQFIDTVREGRGERLTDNPDIFSGLVWTGEQSVTLGLVDGLASASHVARELIGAENIVNYTPRPDFLQRFSERFGVAMAKALAEVVGRTPNLQ
ncbi:MAG TPA: S49 family peptidase [Gammaproteobacteria bacterium]|nr:S49 family peptidase [Gammaproteobacteria bacterium]